ncbi:MAG: PAS domain-containing protein [Deltaproteobacteria bacterium]|nr:PAS domain-containing protein [Nannocystaceae bacterium]
MMPSTALARSRAGGLVLCGALAIAFAGWALASPTPAAAAIGAGIAGLAAASIGIWAVVSARRSRVRSHTADSQELAALRDVIEIAGIGEWRWDLRSNRIVYSRACASMLGYAPGEIDQALAAWGKLAHPDDLPQVRASVDDLCDGRRTHYEHRVRLRAADGSWQTILDRGRVVARDPRGRPTLAMGVHIDLAGMTGAGEAEHPSNAAPLGSTRGACVVVDDDPSVRVVVEIAGRRTGMRMLAFADADSAWSAIMVGGTPLAIITDFDMPRTTGVELAERVRDAGLDCPVLLMSGRPREEFSGCAVVRGVLSKPFSLGELSAWLTALAIGASERSDRPTD